MVSLAELHPSLTSGGHFKHRQDRVQKLVPVRPQRTLLNLNLTQATERLTIWLELASLKFDDDVTRVNRM